MTRDLYSFVRKELVREVVTNGNNVLTPGVFVVSRHSTVRVRG